MNKKEIMAMDGQELCGWLNERCVFSETDETIRQFYTTGSPIKWNLWACAGAARDYVVGKWWANCWIDALCSVTDYDCEKYQLIAIATPLDMLRAAAIVIAEQDLPK
jgi:hypothetical protein